MNPPQNQSFNSNPTSDNNQLRSESDSHPNLFPLRRVSGNRDLKPEQLNTVVVSQPKKSQPRSQKLPTQTQKSPKIKKQRQRGKKTQTSVVKLKSRQQKSEPVAVVPQPNQVNHAQSRRPRNRQTSGGFSVVGLSLLQMLILGTGLGAIAGTVLANLDLTKPILPGVNLSKFVDLTQEKTAVVETATETITEEEIESSSLASGKELVALKTKIEALVPQDSQLESGAFFVELDQEGYISSGGENVFAAASTIKIPVLVAFFEAVDRGEIALDEMLTMKPELIASGSGNMQYQEPGKQFTALETATKMITISDNTATNMLIERLGGAEVLNARFKEWGLENTVLYNPLPDLEGTNITSPKDLATLLARVEGGELISLRSRDRLLRIMEGTVTKTLLPQGLEKDAAIAHKTGDIGTVLGDAGIIDMPSGKRYIAAVMVKRPHNDPAARTLIQEMSRTAYQHFKWYQPRSFIKEGD